jgi:hypothetical protein
MLRGSNQNIEKTMQIWEFSAKEARPTGFISNPMCTAYGRNLPIANGHESHCSSTQIQQFSKKNEVIMSISPSHIKAAFQIFDRQIKGMAYSKHVGNNIASTNITMENCKDTTCNFY